MASTNAIDFQLSQARALLSEFDNRLREIDSKWETRVGVLETKVADSARNLETISKEIRDGVVAQLAAAEAGVDFRIRLLETGTIIRVAALESTAHAFELWRPHVDLSIDSLFSSIDAVCTEVEKLGIHRFPGPRPSDGAAAPGTATQPEPSSHRPRSSPPPEDHDGDDDDDEIDDDDDDDDDDEVWVCFQLHAGLLGLCALAGSGFLDSRHPISWGLISPVLIEGDGSSTGSVVGWFSFEHVLDLIDHWVGFLILRGNPEKKEGRGNRNASY